MSRDQKFVAAGAASGIAAMLLLMWLLYRLLPIPATIGVADRIGYALRWNALAALPLVAMLGAVGNARFLGQAIDPTAGKEDARTEIDGRVGDNTLQQFALFLAGSLALAAALPDGSIRIVGAASITFVLMRIAFWIGYRIRPVYRAFGFAGTAYLNVGLLAAALYLSVR
jgi:hypothetical protein